VPLRRPVVSISAWLRGQNRRAISRRVIELSSRLVTNSSLRASRAAASGAGDDQSSARGGASVALHARVVWWAELSRRGVDGRAALPLPAGDRC
jgi:hypothetical protein